MSNKKFLTIGLGLIFLFIIVVIAYVVISKSSNNTGNNEILEREFTPTLDDLIEEKIKSGTWSEEEAIINTLNALKSENGLSNEFGSSEIQISELTAITQRVDFYLQFGEDEDAKEEIEELYFQIFPNFDVLLGKEEPQSNTKTKIRLGNSIIGNVYAQDCNASDSTRYNGINPDCYNEISREILGHDVSLFVPISWALTEAHYNAWFEAIEQSYRTYSRSGIEQRDVKMLFSSGSASSGSRALMTTGWPYMSRNSDICPIYSWGGANGYLFSSAARFRSQAQQIIAHEMFHCVQYINFRDQASVGRSYAIHWIEGGAEYASDVAFPNANQEMGWNSRFDNLSDSTPWHRMDYEAYVNLMGYANQAGGLDSLYNLMSRMPTTNGYEAQARALSNLGEMQEIFHTIGEKYLSRQLVDNGGNTLTTNPTFGDEVSIDNTQEYATGTIPLVHHRVKLKFEEDKKYGITTDTEGPEGESSVIFLDEVRSGNWKEVPEHVPEEEDGGPDQDKVGVEHCNDDIDDEIKDYLLLVTSMSGENRTHTLKLDVEVEEEESLEEGGEGIPEEPQIDECLIGTWELDPSSVDYLIGDIENLAEENAGEHFTFNTFETTGQTCFNRDNYSFSTYTNRFEIEAFSDFIPDEVTNVLQDFGTETRAKYSASDGVITSWAQVGDGGGFFTAESPSVREFQDIPVSGSKVTQLSYQCSGSNLSITTPGTGPTGEPIVVQMRKVR